MVLIKLQGGLGNQMFQYAAAKSLAYRHNVPLFLDLSFLKKNNVSNLHFTARNFQLDTFVLDCAIADTHLINKIFNKGFLNKMKSKLSKNKINIYNEHSFTYDTNWVNLKPPVYLDGYFQSEKYFSETKNVVLADFKFNYPVTSLQNMELLTLIADNNSVALHIRRGDYVSKKSTNDFHGICSLDYYNEAIAYMKLQFDNLKIFVFSDDLEWAKENVVKEHRNYASLVSFNTAPENCWKDMFLMSKCKHHIIANSSFSWWGAWLAHHPEQVVITPRDWFNTASEFYNTKDLIPDRWIKI
jgi:hypothetical protein